MSKFRFDVKIYNPKVFAGDWVYILGYLFYRDEPCKTCEVWLAVDDIMLMPQYTFQGGKFFFWFRARSGFYRLKFIGYRIPTPDGDVIVESSIYGLKVIPKLFNLSPLVWQVKVYRKMTYDNIKYTLKSVKKYLTTKYKFKEVYLVGSIARKGYSYYDIDLLAMPLPSKEEAKAIEDELMRIYRLPFNLRPNVEEEVMIKL